MRGDLSRLDGIVECRVVVHLCSLPEASETLNNLIEIPISLMFPHCFRDLLSITLRLVPKPWSYRGSGVVRCISDLRALFNINFHNMDLN